MARGQVILLMVGLLGWQVGIAAEGMPPDLLKSVAKLVPGLTADSVSPSPIPGLYEVVFAPHVIYVSRDGRYMFRGDVVDLETQANLTEGKRKQARSDAIERLGEESMIVFSPDNDSHTVSVFTDVDCGYCRKLHSEMTDYNALGIKVRYLAFPRAGVPSASYSKTVSVWCADDQRQAMTDAKAGKRVPSKDCENPVREHYMMGRMLGVSGTPTIVTESGDLLPGYVPAEQLMLFLNADKEGS